MILQNCKVLVMQIKLVVVVVVVFVVVKNIGSTAVT